MLVPAHAGAGAERLGDALLGLESAQREHERARDVDTAVRVGQRECLLFGHRVGAGGRVVLDVPARRLPAQPFGDITSAGLRPGRQFLGGGWPGGQRLVQA